MGKNIGFFNLAVLALFAVGSFAVHIPKHHDLESKEDNENGFLKKGKKWVVLVAGSKGWNNYRHQADICHAYQIIRGNGIPKENIITMMVDDIAYNSKNPTPGKIINKPNGPDVYKGVVIDYKGKDVNSANFINIITGNKNAMKSKGTGKVIEGGPHDKIFINFVDHGSTGLLVFPEEFLYADQLNKAFKTMYGSASYREVLLYIEACEAGSMFDGILREDTDILAITASGPRESSYGCYCRSQSGPYKTCLGDLFSVTWMEELDAIVSESFEKKRTVFNDFKVVRTNVTASNVMVYGDFNTGHEKLSEFIGSKNYTKPKSTVNSEMSNSAYIKHKITVPSRDVHMDTVQHHRMEDKLTYLEKQKLEKEIYQNNKMRVIIDTVFRTIYSMVMKARPDIVDETGSIDEPKHLELSLDMFPCYRNILNKISESCFSLPKNPYTFNRLKFFANLCVVDMQIHDFVGKIIDVSCANIAKSNINDVY